MNELNIVDGWLVIEGVVKLATTSIPSENFMYKMNIKGRCLYKDPTIADYQYNFELLAIKTDLVKIKEYKDKWEEIRVEFHYYLRPKRKIWGLDVTNMTKATEDALVKVTGIDDSCHKSVSSEKYENTLDDSEFIRVVYRIKLKP